ncbi:transketolase, partial [Flavobacterium sp. LBUM151]
VLEAKKEAWNSFINPIIEDQKNLLALLEQIAEASINHKERIQKYISELSAIKSPLKKEMLAIARKILRFIEVPNSKVLLSNWITNYIGITQGKFSSNLYSESNQNVFSVE